MELNAAYLVTATVLDSKGNTVAGAKPDWSSSDTSVATVNVDGMVTGHRNGTARIIARMGHVTGEATIVVDFRGKARVIVLVSGGGVDPDGFSLILLSTWFHMKDTAMVYGLRAGPQPFGLGEIARHCQAIEDPITVTIEAGKTVDAVFHVRCAGRYAFIDGYSNREELGYVDETGNTRMLVPATIVGLPSWSPDGSRLAYIRRGDGSTDLYTVRPDGSAPMRLTNDPDTEAAPAWSPDGKRIVYTSSGRLYTMAADGSDKRAILDASTGFQAGAVWSPGGDYLAVSRHTQTSNGISVLTPDGSNFRDLTSGFTDLDPVWSPDGKSIAFVRYVTTLTWRLMIVAIDGSSVREIARSQQGAMQPAWSPDGRRIAYTKNEGGAYGVWLANVDGSHDHPLTAQFWFGMDPAWTADGAHIALTIPYNGVSGIGMVEPDGSGMQLVFTREEARNPIMRPL